VSARGCSGLLAAAVRFARGAGASALEAYPVEVTAPGKRQSWYTGYVSIFARAGFRKVGARQSDQPVMQRILRPG